MNLVDSFLCAAHPLLLSSLALGAAACAPTSHPAGPAALGRPSAGSSLEAVIDEPGPVTVETVVGADWHVPLSGLLNLEHPKAVAAHLEDREEPVQVVFHAIRHPVHGTFIVDTGVERALFDDPDEAAINGLVATVAGTDDMVRRTDTRAWIDKQSEPVAGVFLTHLHADHVSGLRDVPEATPVFVGPGEADDRSFENFFVGPVVDRALEGKPALSVWRFEPDPDGSFDGVVDVFADGSVWALHVPGHTPGSTAFVARTPTGAVLLTGDACHTAWGWDNGVEPGTFSHDRARSAVSLDRLRKLAARHPAMEVRLGHQPRSE